MSNVKIDQVPRLGLLRPQENSTIQKVSRLGIASNQLDYEDSFKPINIKYVKLLIERLRNNYLIDNKFDAANYVDSTSFLKNQTQKDLLAGLSSKKDAISIAQETIPYKPQKTKEELEREIEVSYYFLLSKSISLNTTVAFIDNEASRNGYRINLDYENEIISYSYVIYYNVSDESIIRKDSKIDTSKTNFAVILNAGGVETLFFFIEKAYTKSDADILRKKIFDDYNVELNKTTDVETLAFLYDNLPHYIELGFEIIEPNEKEPKKYKLSDELLWKHLKLFVDYDNGLSDASYYVVKLMSLISPKFCLQQFVKDQSLVVKIYNGLDDRNGINELFGVYKFSKTFEISGTTFEHSNKDAFISLLNTYIQLNEGDPEVVVFESSGAHFHQGIKKEGKYDAVVQFTLNSNIVLSDSKENKVEISNHWESKKYLGQALDSQGHISEQYDIERGYNESGYFNPLDVVKFTQYNDKGEAITINVPAIYVKYASDLAEWEKVDKALRLGVDILMIIGGIATITSGAGSLLLYAAISDVGLAYTDIIIQSETDKAYFKSKEGKEFLESWDKIYTVGSVVTFSPNAIKAVATYGPKLISSGAELFQVTGKTITNPEVYKKVKDLTTKAIYSIEIPNFNKIGLEILKKGFTEFVELKNARKLQDLGVIFAKGAENTVAVFYKGVVIAYGKVEIVALQLKRALHKLTGTSLKKYLDELVELAGMTENIATTKNVDLFLASAERLASLNITARTALKYLDEALPHFNHHVADGVVKQIGNSNCVEVVKVVEEYLRTGKISQAVKSLSQELRVLEDFYKLKFTKAKIPEIKEVMKEGDKGILYCKREPIKYPSGKIEINDHVMNILKKDGELLLIEGQTAQFIHLEKLTYANSRYIEFKYIIIK